MLLNRASFNSNSLELTTEQVLDQLLTDALQMHASDIHIEPFEHFIQIRFRCDGLLRYYQQCDFEQGLRIISRLKIMAKLDISEKRKSQDGHFSWLSTQLANTTKTETTETKAAETKAAERLDFRLSTLATLWGEKIVLRLLILQQCLTITQLGMTDEQLQYYQNALNAPQGLIIISGPTGSGKTSSLYAGLNLLNNEQRNICTVEDPIEIYLHGVNQVTVNSSIGLTFTQVLRTFLRQDPDVLMIGEIRDKQTADVAMSAAQTGHLVLSTIHTNNAKDVLSRLQHMDLSLYNLHASIILIIAQRLLRKLCPHCSHHWQSQLPYQAEGNRQSIEIIKKIQRHKISHKPGCEFCYQGYSGRVAIFSVLPIYPLESTIATKQLTESLTLYQHAALLVEQGISTIDEIYRVLGT